MKAPWTLVSGVTFLRILRNVITYPCPTYLLLTPNNSSISMIINISYLYSKSVSNHSKMVHYPDGNLTQLYIPSHPGKISSPTGKSALIWSRPKILAASAEGSILLPCLYIRKLTTPWNVGKQFYCKYLWKECKNWWQFLTTKQPISCVINILS